MLLTLWLNALLVLTCVPGSLVPLLSRGRQDRRTRAFLLSLGAVVLLVCLTRMLIHDDGAAGVVAPFVAELLGWPVLTNLTELSIDGDSVRATQASETATVELSAQLPAVVSVADGFADPRYPNFKGLMAAKKKELNTVSLAGLGVDPEDFTHPRAIMVDIERRPERERGEIIDGNSSAATRLVDFLESKNLI